MKKQNLKKLNFEKVVVLNLSQKRFISGGLVDDKNDDGGIHTDPIIIVMTPKPNN